jgi:sulfur carrier protein
MKIELKLFVTLSQYGKEIQTVDLPERATVSDVIEMFKIPENMPKLNILNNVHVKRDHVLKDGDTLALFPPIAGG